MKLVDQLKKNVEAKNVASGKTPEEKKNTPQPNKSK